MEKQPETILDLVKEIYDEWDFKSDEDFINDVKEKNADDFAIRLHNGIGRQIRNDYGLWKGDTPLYNYCKSIGLEHPDDMSHRILMELHKYATEQLNNKN